MTSAGCQHVKQVNVTGPWMLMLLAVFVWDTLWNVDGPSTLKDCCSVIDPLGGRGKEERDETQFVLDPGSVPQEELAGRAGSKTCRKEPTHGPLMPNSPQRSVPPLILFNSASVSSVFP